jgi:hypothetical protein
MLLHAFPSMFVSSLHEFSENYAHKRGGIKSFIVYLHRKLSNANFLSKKSAFIGFAY